MKCPYRKTTRFTKQRVKRWGEYTAEEFLYSSSRVAVRTIEPCTHSEADTVTEDFEDCLQHKCACFTGGKCGRV